MTKWFKKDNLEIRPVTVDGVLYRELFYKDHCVGQLLGTTAVLASPTADNKPGWEQIPRIVAELGDRFADEVTAVAMNTRFLIKNGNAVFAGSAAGAVRTAAIELGRYVANRANQGVQDEDDPEVTRLKAIIAKAEKSRRVACNCGWE